MTLHKTQYKGNCTTFGKYGHKSKDFWHGESSNVPKCNYYNMVGHLKKEYHNINK